MHIHISLTLIDRHQRSYQVEDLNWLASFFIRLHHQAKMFLSEIQKTIDMNNKYESEIKENDHMKWNLTYV